MKDMSKNIWWQVEDAYGIIQLIPNQVGTAKELKRSLHHLIS